MFPMTACFEPEHGGVEPCLAVDYYDLEVQQKQKSVSLVAPSPAAQSQVVAVSLLRMKKTKGWVKHHLGHL
jgi:hypothetical protein